MTYQQQQTAFHEFRKDLEWYFDSKVKEMAERTIKTIEDKVPFTYLEQLMKQKANIATFLVTHLVASKRLYRMHRAQ